MNKTLLFACMAVFSLATFSCNRQPKTVETPAIDYADTSYWYSFGDESHTADSTMPGLVVFNSVTDTTAIGMISCHDVVGINPTTWTMTTDTVPAYEQMFPKGNLHFADSWLFGGNVVENMRCRLRNH